MIFGPYRGIVDIAHDGDTVHVRLDAGFDLTVYARVRLLTSDGRGINAPELSTPEGKAARDFVQTLVPSGTRVTVVSHGWDKYGGRIDGAIWIGDGYVGDDLAAQVVAAGHAVYRDY